MVMNNYGGDQKRLAALIPFLQRLLCLEDEYSTWVQVAPPFTYKLVLEQGTFSAEKQVLVWASRLFSPFPARLIQPA